MNEGACCERGVPRFGTTARSPDANRFSRQAWLRRKQRQRTKLTSAGWQRGVTRAVRTPKPAHPQSCRGGILLLNVAANRPLASWRIGPLFLRAYATSQPGAIGDNRGHLIRSPTCSGNSFMPSIICGHWDSGGHIDQSLRALRCLFGCLGSSRANSKISPIAAYNPKARTVNSQISGDTFGSPL